MVKLIVQIPCYNEAETLPATIADIPRRIGGLEKVEVLVVDDGSSDGTAQAAARAGADHVVRCKKNLGLAKAFGTGIEACLKLGADIIVNTDGDNQYAGADIEKLVRPILDGAAEIVIGDRRTSKLAHFPLPKKILHKLGGFAVRTLSKTDVPDAVSGFRAISREAALRLNIVTSFSYTIEMLIQAGSKKLAIASVPVAVNPPRRDSRLFTSTWSFVKNSAAAMVRMYAMYQPLKTFFYIGLALTLIGAVPVVRFVYLYFTEGGAGHVQSLVLGGAFLVIGFITFMFALLADLINFNRQLIETTLEKVRRLELSERDDGRP